MNTQRVDDLSPDELDKIALAYAERWCAAKGEDWVVEKMLGRGGTAPVFMIKSPDGGRALKVLDPKYSEGDLGLQTEIRIQKQVDLGEHTCPYIVVFYDGGWFEDRLFLLMNRAEGDELEKRLPFIPRPYIRSVVDQVAQAAIFLRERGLSHRDLKSANVFISEDFERVTVLDLSVLRDIHDPVGIGTDHDNQLPVVATSRYTPPEYLFRLDDPSPELWHGVDVYQLGGLLHDLIMREPMFTSEYASSKENRYRFAWIVATIDPIVRAADVDADLVLLARRALDKNWERRRLLTLEDFLVDGGAQSQGLAALGIATMPREVLQLAAAPRPVAARELAVAIEDQVLEYLKEKGLTPTHALDPTDNDWAWRVRWAWHPVGGDVAREVQLDALVSIRSTDAGPKVEVVATVIAEVDEQSRTAQLELPDTDLVDGVDDELTRLIIAALGPLAAEALSAKAGDA